MPDFVLNAEQQEFQALAREFAQKEMVSGSHASRLSSEQLKNLFKKAWEIGLTTSCLAEEFGGLSLPLLETTVIAEELSAGNSGFAGVIEANLIVQILLDKLASEEQKQKFLPTMSDSPVLIGLEATLFTEQVTRPVCQKSDSGHFLNGRVEGLVNGQDCSWIVISAVNGTARSLFIIPRDGEGIQLEGSINQLGRGAMNMQSVNLRNVVVPAVNYLGDVDQVDFRKAQSHCLCLLAAGAVGLARAGMEHAVRYAKERQTFGQIIAKHQAISFMIADMAKEIEAARLLTRQAIETADDAAEGMVAAMVAYSFAQDMAMRVTTDAVQVFGGYGYSSEYPVEQLMRDAKSLQVYQRGTIESKLTLGKQLLDKAAPCIQR